MARTPVEERILIPRYIKGQIFRECGQRCCHCGKQLEFFGDFTLEHAIPLSKGGTNDRRNLVGLCRDCNWTKSNDIIPPIEYFCYLPEKKLTDLQAMFDDYVSSQDWLDYDNLFMTDWFTVMTDRAIMAPKRRQLLYAPMECRVQRIREHKAYELIQDYKQYLTDTDKALMIQGGERVEEPYYEVFWKNQRLMFFTTYIAKGDAEFKGDDWEYILHFDYYFNPELPFRRITGTPTLYNVINGILLKIQETLLNGSQGTAILVRLRTPHTSPHANDLSDFYNQIHRGFCEVYDVGVNTYVNSRKKKEAYIRIIEFVMFQNTNRSVKKLMAEYGVDNINQLINVIDTKGMQQSIKERLDKSIRFGENKHLKPPKS